MTAAERAGRSDAADIVDGVIEASHGATVGWVSNLDDVDGRGRGGDAVTEAEQEAAAEKLAKAAGEVGGAFDNGAEYDTRAADKHASTTTPGVDSGADEGQGTDAADGVHGGDVASLDADDGGAESLLEGGHDEHVTHEAAVVTVDARAKESNGDDGIELEHAAVARLRRFLFEGGLEGLGALHDNLVHADGVHILLCWKVVALDLRDREALDMLVGGLAFVHVRHICKGR